MDGQKTREIFVGASIRSVTKAQPEVEARKSTQEFPTASEQYCENGVCIINWHPKKRAIAV